MTQELDDFRAFLTKNTPLIDVRSPIEFAKGSLPGSVNLPLMEDHEREARWHLPTGNQDKPQQFG